jgi:hypothetical protein
VSATDAHRVYPIRGMAGLIAVLALALGVVGPAAAKQKPKHQPKPQIYTAKLDCGSGPINVASGADLFAPLVQLRTGRRFYPVYWSVKAHGHVIKQTKPGGWHGHSIKCSYDDGIAVGTVRVLAPKRHSHSKHKHG